MDQNKLLAVAKELAKDIKTENDLGELSKQLVKLEKKGSAAEQGR